MLMSTLYLPRLATTLAILGCILLAPWVSAQIQTLDKVVAIVDDDIILATELQERLLLIQRNIEQRQIEAPPDEVLARETLDRLILESIQLQLANRYGVRIPDAQLDAAMSRMASGSNYTLEQFRAAVEANGQSYLAMREEMREAGREMRHAERERERALRHVRREVERARGRAERDRRWRRVNEPCPFCHE